MNHRWSERLLLATASLVVGASAHGQDAATSRAVAPSAVAGLVEQLKDVHFGTRQRAMTALMKMGPSAGEAVREALRNRDLPREARERLEHVLRASENPETGAVWRGRLSQEPPEGITDGDVVVSLDGVPVESISQFYRIAVDGTHRLGVWRKGKGSFQITTTFHELAALGFRVWPDWLEEYQRWGQKGPWDAKVEQAIREWNRMRASPSALLDEVYDAGCRDALVVYLGLREANSIRAKEAAARYAALSPGDLKGDYPGGLYSHGHFPIAVATWYATNGDRDRAGRTLDEALQRANQDSAWRAVPVLSCVKLGLEMARSPEAARAFWSSHVEEILAGIPEIGAETVALTASTLAADGNPAQAVEFLRTLPPADSGGLLAYYQQQARLAAQNPRAPLQKVLVRVIPPIGPFSNPWEAGDVARSFAAPSSGTLEYELRILESPTENINKTGEAWGVLLCAGGRPIRRIWAGLHPLGMVRTTVEGPQWNEDLVTYPVYDTSAWTRFELNIQPGKARVRVNGNPFCTYYYSPWQAPNLRGAFGIKNGTAEVRNIRVYAYSASPADNAATEKLFADLDKARRAGDLAAASAAHRGIMKVLAGVPEAADVRGELQAEMDAYEAILSPEGWIPSAADRLKRMVGYWSHGEWKLEGETLVASPCPDCLYAYLRGAAPLPDDFEILGDLQVIKPDVATRFYLSWNSANFPPNTYCCFLPRAGQVGLVDGKNYQNAQGVDFSTPLPFCIRVRGEEAAVFLRFGSKPDLRLSGLRRVGDHLELRLISANKDTRVRLGRFQIRALPKGMPLDAPVRMSGDSKATTKRDW